MGALNLAADVHSSGVHNLSRSPLKVALPEQRIQQFAHGVHSTGIKIMFTLLGLFTKRSL